MLIAFLMGILATTALIGAGYAGYRMGTKAIPKPQAPELTMEEQKAQEARDIKQQQINKILNYDEATARSHYRQG